MNDVEGRMDVIEQRLIEAIEGGAEAMGNQMRTRKEGRRKQLGNVVFRLR